jgi:hypothetical protein
MMSLAALSLIAQLCVTSSDSAYSSRNTSARCQINMIKCVNLTAKTRHIELSNKFEQIHSQSVNEATLIQDCVLSERTMKK